MPAGPVPDNPLMAAPPAAGLDMPGGNPLLPGGAPYTPPPPRMTERPIYEPPRSSAGFKDRVSTRIPTSKKLTYDPHERSDLVVSHAAMLPGTVSDLSRVTVSSAPAA